MDDGQVEKIVKEIVKRRAEKGEGDFIPHDDVQFAFWDPAASDRPPESHEHDMWSAHCALKKMGYEERYRPHGYERVSAQQSAASGHRL